ncbi:hypothetical protein FRC07_013191 [Ceratobasidium sp. 392]|nr:hypothetical protein FRC07_013191 [Ceratobasidium sp. 392]
MAPARKASSALTGRKATRVSKPQFQYGAEVFEGLHLDAGPKRAAVRHVPYPDSPTVRSRKPIKRSKEQKVKHDLERLLLRMLTKAIANRVVLPFKMADFRRARDSSKGVKLVEGGPFGPLATSPTFIKMKDGPRLVVDLDGEIILTYLPGLIGKGLQVRAHLFDQFVLQPDGPNGQRMLQNALNTLVVSSSPAIDKSKGDRRSSVRTAAKACETGAANDPWPNLTIKSLKPSAYYWSCGWFGTAQQNVSKITVAVPFRKVLSGQKAGEATAVLESKRIYDFVVRLLVFIIHQKLADSLEDLLRVLAEQEGLVGETTRNGWTSLFPCVAFAFNRETGKHRDSLGCRGGLDVIGVLGSFTGGPLKFQDLNMDVEWQPGCVGAFDGYDLTHEVQSWSGSRRIALISFCRAATWDGLKLTRHVSHPSLNSMEAATKNALAFREANIASKIDRLPTTDA